MSGMFDIFVNYRTVDGRFGAASAHEALARRFGGDRVFLDHVSIQSGADYPERIVAALEEVRVLVVLIGPHWFARDPATGIRFIDREGDWVRREIRRAVQRGITIIPVLLDGAPAPSADELPGDVRVLSRCQAAEVRHRSLGADLDRLGDSVARYVPVGGTAWRRSWWRAAAVVLVTAFASTGSADARRLEPVANTVIGDFRTADPCALIDAAPFRGYGETRLDRAYGSFQRCDLIVAPESDAPVDIEVRFEEDPLPEGAEPASWVGAIGIVASPGESSVCDRTLTLPPGNGDITVVVRAEVDDEPDTAPPLCEVADAAATVAATVLDEAHRAGGELPRRFFPEESLAHLDTCQLLGGDALAAVIPGVDVTEPDVGYGQWKCVWRSTSHAMRAHLQFDQSEPLNASDGLPTRIGGREAFVARDWEGAGSCTVRVVHRSHPGQYEETVVELLMMTVAADEDGEFEVCRMATDLATAAVGALPQK